MTRTKLLLFIFLTVGVSNFNGFRCCLPLRFNRGRSRSSNSSSPIPWALRVPTSLRCLTSIGGVGKDCVSPEASRSTSLGGKCGRKSECDCLTFFPSSQLSQAIPNLVDLARKNLLKKEKKTKAGTPTSTTTPSSGGTKVAVC